MLVDDYDLVATPGGNPLQPLAELLPQARDIGLHLVLARRSGGAARALYEPVMQRLRELGSPGVVLSGSRDEGALRGRRQGGAAPTRPGPVREPAGRSGADPGRLGRPDRMRPAACDPAACDPAGSTAPEMAEVPAAKG